MIDIDYIGSWPYDHDHDGPVNRRRIDNTIPKTLHWNLKIGQYEHHNKLRMNSGAPEYEISKWSEISKINHPSWYDSVRVIMKRMVHVSSSTIYNSCQLREPNSHTCSWTVFLFSPVSIPPTSLLYIVGSCRHFFVQEFSWSQERQMWLLPFFNECITFTCFVECDLRKTNDGLL